MKLAWKLTLLLAVAAAGPLIVTTQYTVSKGSQSLRAQLQQQFDVRAQLYAGLTDDYLREKWFGVQRTIKSFQADRLSEEGLKEFLRLVYVQHRHVTAVGFFNAGGEPIVDAVLPRRNEISPDQLPFREAMDEASVASFQQHIAVEDTLKDKQGVVFSKPYVSRAHDGAFVPRVVINLRVERQSGPPAVLAAELSLRPLVQRFQAEALEVSTALIDEDGRAMIHPDPKLVEARADMSGDPGVLAAQGKGRGYVAAGSRAAVRPWTVLVSEPERTALAVITNQERYARYVVLLGLLAAALVGLFAVRTVTGRLGKLREAAAKVAGGDLDTKVEMRGKDELAELGAAFNQMVRGLQERQRLKQTFSRYVSGEIAARILSETSDLDLKGEQVEVTVLFIDMRGFTSLSEKHTPREVVDMLNSYFEEIVGAVLHHDGVINKFIGDAVVAVFGVPRAVPHPEERALAAAVEIQRRIGLLNAERKARGLEVAGFGVGINTGPAIAGNIGSAQRMEYTVIGDAVNVAQRLLGQAAAGEVIASRATLDRVRKGRFASEPRGSVKLKGKEVSVETYAVVADREAA